MLTKLTRDYWHKLALDWAEQTAAQRLPGPQHDEMLQALEELRAEITTPNGTAATPTTTANALRAARNAIQDILDLPCDDAGERIIRAGFLDDARNAETLINAALQDNADLATALENLLHAKNMARTVVGHAGRDEDIYYNGSDMGHAEDAARAVLAKVKGENNGTH